MKNLFQITMIVAFLISFSFASNAQIQFGVRAGLNGSNFSQSVEDPEDKLPTKTKLGFHLGLIMDVGIDEKLSFSSGLIYITKGVAQDLSEGLPEGFTVDGSSVINLNYLEIPLNIAYELDDIKIFGGPFIGIGLNGKFKDDYTISFDGDESKIDESVDLKSAFGEVSQEERSDFDGGFINGIDFGLNLGIGYDVGPVMLSLGYSLSLKDIEPKYEDREKDEDSITNRVFSLSATYMFGSGTNMTEDKSEKVEKRKRRR